MKNKIVEATGRGRLVAGALRALMTQANAERVEPRIAAVKVTRRDAYGNVIGEHVQEFPHGND